MKDSRSFLVLLLALVLITVAIVLVSLWGYKMYFGEETPSSSLISEKNNRPAPDTVYIPLNKSESQIPDPPQDSTEWLLIQKLNELNRLQAEINALMQQSDTTNTLNLQDKVSELRQNVVKLQEKNDRAPDNSSKSVKRKQKSAENPVSNNIKHSPLSNTETREKPPVTIDRLRMLVDETGDTGPNGEPMKKISVNFSIVTDTVENGEIFVVITQPNGRVLMNSPWESGVFEVPEGQKIYTGKLYFNPSKHHLNFSMETTTLRNGTYTVSIYYEGKVLGMFKKTIS